MNKISKWLKTYEDWAPSFNKGKTQNWINPEFKEPNPYKLGLLASCGPLNGGKFRVSVWGADDMGMDIDFSTRNEAKALFHALPKVVDQAILTRLGFNRF